MHDGEEAAQLLRQLGGMRYTGKHSPQPLTRREDEVYALLLEGLSNHEIAERLVLSAKTVEHHISSILTKLGARSRAEAIALSIKGSSKQTNSNPPSKT